MLFGVEVKVKTSNDSETWIGKVNIETLNSNQYYTRTILIYKTECIFILMHISQDKHYSATKNGLS